MKTVLTIVQETVNKISEEIKLEYEKELNKEVERLSLKYKTKFITECTRYCSSVKFEMSQRFDRDIIELNVVLPKSIDTHPEDLG